MAKLMWLSLMRWVSVRRRLLATPLVEIDSVSWMGTGETGIDPLEGWGEVGNAGFERPKLKLNIVNGVAEPVIRYYLR